MGVADIRTDIRAIVLHAGIDGHALARHRRVSILHGLFAATTLTAAPPAPASAPAALSAFTLRQTIGLRLAAFKTVSGFGVSAFFARQHGRFDGSR